MKKAVILFSGGLDSTTVLQLAHHQNFDCYPISFFYGQRHAVELEAAKRIVCRMGIVNHHVVQLPGNLFGASALTEGKIAVPAFDGSNANKIPVTYVPARNTIFLSIALGYAESIGAHDIFLGVSHVDYSGYPDCRPAYLNAFETLANLATKDGVDGKKIMLHAPLLYLTKAETIQLGIKHGVDYSLTISCYNSDPVSYAACGVCDSCYYRKKGFEEANVLDPTLYVS